jgi:hypothetical protein
VTLRGIGAGFIERIYLREIAFDGLSIESAKTDAGCFLKTVRLSAREMANEDCRPNFMRSAAQSRQELFRMREISRLADYLALERHECVRTQDHGLGGATRYFQGLSRRVADGRFANREPCVRDFRHRRQNDVELVSRLFQ